MQIAPVTTPFNAKTAQQKLLPLVAVVAAAIALAAPVHADVDTDFANQLDVYGVHGPRDQNAWLGKITCNRLGNGIDADAYKSAAFLSKNLPQDTTTEHTWQFLNAAITTYCPDQMSVLTSATIRTARSRSSGGYLLDEPPDMTPTFLRNRR